MPSSRLQRLRLRRRPAARSGPTSIRPRSQAPQSGAQSRAASGSATTSGPVDPAWWNSFGDRELSSLVSRLVSQNIDLQTAVERIRQAADETDVARSQGLPQVNGNSSYTHERQSPNGFIALVQPSPAASYDYDIWTNGLSASWELDLFGRVRRAVEARRAGTVAAVEARHAVALASISTLAQDYLQLRGTQARLRIAQRNLWVTQKNMSLVDVQFANGVGTTLAVAQARAEVATVAATMPPLVTTAAALENAIALLLAEPPRALEAELDAPAPAAIVPPTVPIGLPADLIRRRPDVREAEATLHEATAETGVALADFYPDVSLTGNFELQGRNVLNAFSLPDRAFVAGPGNRPADLRRWPPAGHATAAALAAARSGGRLPQHGAAGLGRRGQRPNRLCAGPATARADGRGGAGRSSRAGRGAGKLLTGRQRLSQCRCGRKRAARGRGRAGGRGYGDRDRPRRAVQGARWRLAGGRSATGRKCGFNARSRV